MPASIAWRRSMRTSVPPINAVLKKAVLADKEIRQHRRKRRREQIADPLADDGADRGR